MYEIIFYEDKNGTSQLYNYMQELDAKKDKFSRVYLNRIKQNIKMLQDNGTLNNENFVKHIEGEIWELRPIPNRILFAAWVGNSFVLLHHFRKDTKKTPRREIEKAKRELSDFKERSKLK